jgi:poly(hydroxyalkanoate) granule-associated protein
MRTASKTRKTAHMQDLPDEILERGRALAGRSREVWLAGLGAVDGLEKDGAATFDALVRRGRRVEARGRKRLDAARERLGEEEREVMGRVDAATHEVMDRVLGTFGIPTRDEMHALSTRVDALSGKVNALNERMVKRS